MSKEAYEKWTRASSFVLILVGIVGIIFVVVFWAITGRFEFAFLPFFGTIAGVGQGLGVLKEISQNKGGASGDT